MGSRISDSNSGHVVSMREPEISNQKATNQWWSVTWKVTLGLLMVYVIYGAFNIAHGAIGFAEKGIAARIIFFHVPCAVYSSIAYLVATWYAVKYLWLLGDKNKSSAALADTDFKSSAAMELGFLFCILATITGSIFAGVQWGSFWNWDPRETSIVIMLLLYASYLLLRTAFTTDPAKRARLSAVYAVIAVIPSIFLIWVVPRVLQTMHPTTTLSNPANTSLSYKLVLYPSFIAFTMLFIWLMQLRVSTLKLTEARRERRLRALEAQH
jgi:heme exporter protein C